MLVPPWSGIPLLTFLISFSCLVLNAKELRSVTFQGDEATAVERLRQLELNLNTTSRNLLQTKEIGEVSNANKSLVCNPVYIAAPHDHIVYIFLTNLLMLFEHKVEFSYKF